MNDDNSRYVTQDEAGTCPVCGRMFRLTRTRFGDLVIPGHWEEYGHLLAYRCPGSFGISQEEEDSLKKEGLWLGG